MRFKLGYLPLTFSLLFLFVFFYIPILDILKRGLWNGKPSFGIVLSVLRDEYHRHVILFTIGQALLSTLLTVLFALPGAYFFSHYEFPGKRLLKAILTIPFVVPGLMISLAYIVLFGKNGLVTEILGKNLGILYSWRGIVLANVFYNYPVVFRIVSVAWESFNRNYDDVSLIFGVKGFKKFFRVDLPLLMPSILVAALMTFIFCYLSFTVPLVIGGYRYATIEVDIFTSVVTLLDFQTGAALALIQMIIAVLLIYLYMLEARKLTVRELATKLRRKRRLSTSFFLSPMGVTMLLYFFAVSFVLLLPLLAVVYESLSAGRLSLRWYHLVFSPGYNPFFGSSVLRSIVNSLIFGVSTIFLSVLLAFPLAYNLSRGKIPHWAEPFLILPFATSPVTLALAYIGTYHSTALYMTFWLVAFAHAIIAYPLVFRSIGTGLSRIKESLVEAALTLGSTPLKTFLRVELPLVAGSVVVGASFAFAISVAELGAVYMLAPPDWQTITVAIYSFISARRLGPAAALSVILMLITVASLLAIEAVGEESW